MTETRWLNDDEQDLWRLYLAATRKLTHAVEETLTAGGEVTFPECSVLVSLSEAHGQQLRLRELCEELEWDRSRTSRQVTRMARRGLVSKTKFENDKRGVVVGITDMGMQRLINAVPEHVESVRRLVFDHMHPEDVPTLRRFFTGILNANNLPGYPDYIPDSFLNVFPER
ncbi:MarR family winged helix-turn-helix transcriptional regulator [Corynebacterium camporealensis]